MIIIVYLVLYENIFLLMVVIIIRIFIVCLKSKIFMSVYQCYENKLALMISSPHKQKPL